MKGDILDKSSKWLTQGEATAANLRQERAKRRADDEVDGGTGCKLSDGIMMINEEVC